MARPIPRPAPVTMIVFEAMLLFLCVAKNSDSLTFEGCRRTLLRRRLNFEVVEPWLIGLHNKPDVNHNKALRMVG